MYLLAHIAQPAREHQFHLRVYVFHSLLDDELSALGLSVDALQLVEQEVEFVAGEQADGFEHGDVSHGAEHIVLGEVEVHFAVATYGKAFNIFVYLY